jgi:alpha-D-ribose 1-methylphosphonate 5-phosphate C-P lyase
MNKFWHIVDPESDPVVALCGSKDPNLLGDDEDVEDAGRNGFLCSDCEEAYDEAFDDPTTD